MKRRYLFAVLCVCPMLALFPILAQAEIYKSVDKNGHVTYSSVPLKGGKKLFLEPLPTLAPPSKVHTPEQFPKVTNETQMERDNTRRKILQDELNAEEKLLEEARLNLKEGGLNQGLYKEADGRTYRKDTKYDEKIKQLNDQVDLHQQNTAALKSELSKLKDASINSQTPRKSNLN